MKTLDGQWLGSDLGFLEGPILTPEGDLVVTSISSGTLHLFGPDGIGHEFAKAEAGVNGLTVGAEGQIYGTHIWATHPVPEWKLSTGGVVTWRDGRQEWISRDPVSPNDLCFGPDGYLYVTDPTRGRWNDGRIWRVDPRGDRPAELLLSVPWFPNGIGFGLNENELFVADSGGARLVLFDLVEGHLENERTFAQLEWGVPDGFAIDVEGNIVTCCPVVDGSNRPATVQVWSPEGTLLEQLVVNPDSTHATNCLLTEDSVLYVTDADKGSVLKVSDWPGAGGAPLYPQRHRASEHRERADQGEHINV